MLKEIHKYRKELLNSQRATELVKRWWRIYVSPPKESNVCVDLDAIDEIYTKTEQGDTAPQPKQVVITENKKTALVSCMSGKKLEFFDTFSLNLLYEIKLPGQCVEVTTRGDLAFATTTNFARETPFHNKLWIINIPNREIVSSVDTQGNWSKVAAITPDMSQALISNWQSNSISVIDIKNPVGPKVTQILEIRKCPRGIAFTNDSQIAIVANFYSGNIAELRRTEQRWEIAYTSEPFDHPNYSGNPRHVLISPDNKFAYVSNKGRNFVHVWSIGERKFVTSFVVGKGPNTIDFADNSKGKILVSCSQSDRVCVLDLTSGKIVGTSPKTGGNTTGICALSDTEFLATSFDSNSLEKFTLTSQTN